MITTSKLEEALKKTASERRWYEYATYMVALFLCLLILDRVLKLRHADLSLPFLYADDGIPCSMLIKAVITNGWYLTNDFLGAPQGQEMYDYPMNDNFSYLLIKLMGLFTSNYATVFNLFYLITFPLTTICSLYVLRKFNVSRAPAVVASLLYTFIFYHFAAGQYHLFVSILYPAPLMLMVILWICSEQLSLTRSENGRTRLDLRNPKLIASIFICILIASTGGAYYPFFAVWLLASVALFLAVRHRSLARPLTPVFLIAVISVAFLANIAPNLIYIFKHGKAQVAVRETWEAEMYGLKIAQLVLPANDHRIEALAKLKAHYNLTPLSNNEVLASPLGFVGAIGFLFLLGWLLYRKSLGEADQRRDLFNHLSMLNASAVLIGTIGGFGSLFAHLISPQVRAYARINVYIAFLSFFAVALLLDFLSRRFFQTGPRRVIFCILAALLIFSGVLDQTKAQSRPDPESLKAEFLSDRDFIHQIESQLPQRAMVFQLPVDVFPEGKSYDHLKAYLHSDKLRWSFGAMRGRDGGDWQATIANAPVNDVINTVALANFSGVYIDRSRYPDKGAKIESDISSLLQASPLVSRDGRLSFFELTEYRKILSGDPEKAINPLMAKWQKDFWDKEGSPEDNWRWCSTTGELIIENRLPRERTAIIEMGASSIKEGNLRIEGRNFSEQIQISPANTPFSKQFTIPPGSYSIRFTSTAPAVRPMPDWRLLSFRINNFRLKEIER
jgi:phosphoglycerol transferase